MIWCGQHMLYSRPQIALSHTLGCDLNHNFAVWQTYALNDRHFRLSVCLRTCRLRPRNLADRSNNRKTRNRSGWIGFASDRTHGKDMLSAASFMLLCPFDE
jgi:hypothetical protein